MKCCGLLCIFRCYRSNTSAKKSNLVTLERIIEHLSGSDEEASIAENCLLQRILNQLVQTYDLPHASEFTFQPDKKGSLVKARFLHELASAVASRRRQQPQRPLSGNVYSIHERIDSRASIISRQSPTDGDGSAQCTTRLLPSSTSQSPEFDLISQLEGVKNWSTHAEAAGLTNLVSLNLPRLKPQPCRPDTPGSFRIASWNLNRFTLAKALHPGFREALCLTVLRANISLLVLQEVADLDVAYVLLNELNQPCLPHLKKWLRLNPPDCQPNWNVATHDERLGSMFQGSEYAIFLYNKAVGMDITKVAPIGESNSINGTANASSMNQPFTRKPCSALCRIRGTQLLFISVHLKAKGLQGSRVGRTVAEIKHLGTLVEAFYDTQPTSLHLILLGDFNLNPKHKGFNRLRDKGLINVLPGNRSTMASIATRNAVGNGNKSSAYDNAWVSPGLTSASINNTRTACYTMHSGIISDGLRHPFIPNNGGAGSNGFISDHCPIWFDIFIP